MRRGGGLRGLARRAPPPRRPPPSRPVAWGWRPGRCRRPIPRTAGCPPSLMGHMSKPGQCPTAGTAPPHASPPCAECTAGIPGPMGVIFPAFRLDTWGRTGTCTLLRPAESCCKNEDPAIPQICPRGLGYSQGRATAGHSRRRSPTRRRLPPANAGDCWMVPYIPKP